MTNSKESEEGTVPAGPDTLSIDEVATKLGVCRDTLDAMIRTLIAMKNPKESGEGTVPAGPDAYSIDEVAAKLGVCRDTVNQAIRDGQLRTIKIGGRRRIIPMDAYKDFLARTS